METVLGVSMAPSTVRMVLVEGENADGVTVEEDNIDVTAPGGPPSLSASDRVVSAILGTRQGAEEGGYQLTSTGVTWTDPIEAAALRDVLAARKIENVMLVSAFLAAAALAQSVGNATKYAHTALLFIEPDTATLAVVDTADGSVSDVHRQLLPDDDDEAMATLVAMTSGAESLDGRPQGVFIVGSGVDIPRIKPALEAATSLPVSAPEEPETALARGAALASAHSPLFASSTAALAYAKDPGTGAIDPYAIAPAYFDAFAGAAQGDGALAYSAVPDEDADAYTAVAAEQGTRTGTFAGVSGEHGGRGRKPLWLIASAVGAILAVGLVALVVAVAIGTRPAATVQPNPGNNVVAPNQPAPPAAPAPTAPAAAPAPAPAPAAPAPAPVAPAPAPVPAAPAPAPAPVAPAPAPVPAAPPAPPVPIIVPQLPQIFSPPVQGPPMQPRGGFPGDGGHGGGFPGGGGHGGGIGIPGIPGL